MPLPKDWREFIALLNSSGVEYLIVGAAALAYHGVPHKRATGRSQDLADLENLGAKGK